MTEDRTPTEGRPDLIDRAALRLRVKRNRNGTPLTLDDDGWNDAMDRALALIDAAPAAEPVPLTLDARTVAAAILDVLPEAAVRALPSGYEWAAEIAAALASPDNAGDPWPDRSGDSSGAASPDKGEPR